MSREPCRAVYPLAASVNREAILVDMNASAEELRIDRQAPAQRIELAPNSWVELVPGFVRDAEQAFTELHQALEWGQTEVLRYDHYVAENRLGSGVRTDAYPLLRQTDLHLR